MISIRESITLEFPSGKMEEFTRIELETLYKKLGDYLGKNKETYTPCVDPLTTWPYQSPRQPTFYDQPWTSTTITDLEKAINEPIKCEFNIVDYTNLPKLKEEWIKLG